MTAAETVLQMVQANGVLLLFPLAVIEGPIITVVAGWLVRLGHISIGWAMLILVVADLVGDGLLYALGRYGTDALPPKWRAAFGIHDKRIDQVIGHFSKHGGSTLVAAKLTHTFGFVVLFAAGASRMSLVAFLGFNLVGTIPKTLFFLLIGYAVGEAQVAIDDWIGRSSLAIAILGIAILSFWYWQKKREKT